MNRINATLPSASIPRAALPASCNPTRAHSLRIYCLKAASGISSSLRRPPELQHLAGIFRNTKQKWAITTVLELCYSRNDEASQLKYRALSYSTFQRLLKWRLALELELTGIYDTLQPLHARVHTLIQYVAAERGVLTEVQLAAERDLVGRLRQRLLKWHSLHETVMRQAEGLGDADYVAHGLVLRQLADEFRDLADGYLKVQLRAIREVSEANVQQYRASSGAHGGQGPAAARVKQLADTSSSARATRNSQRKQQQQQQQQQQVPVTSDTSTREPPESTASGSTAASSSTTSSTTPLQLPDFREVTMRYRRTALQFQCYMDQSLYRRRDARAGMPSACDSYFYMGQLAGAAGAAAGLEPFESAALPAAAADWEPGRQLPVRAYGRVLPPRGLLLQRAKQLEAQLAQQQGDEE